MDSPDQPDFMKGHASERSTALGSDLPNPATHTVGVGYESFDLDNFNWAEPSTSVLREFDRRYDIHHSSMDDHGYNSEQNKLSSTQVTVYTTQSSPPSPHVPDQTTARAIERIGSAPPPSYKSAKLPHGRQDSSPSAPLSTAELSHTTAFRMAPMANPQVARVAHGELMGRGNQSSTIKRSRSPEKANHLPTVSSPLNRKIEQPLGEITEAHYSDNSHIALDNQLMNDASSETSYSLARDNTVPIVRGSAELIENDNEDIIAEGIVSVTDAQGPLYHHASQRSNTEFLYLPSNGVFTGGYPRQGPQHAASTSYESVFGYTPVDMHSDSLMLSRHEQPWGPHTSRARTVVPLNGTGIQFSTPGSDPSHGYGFGSPLSQGPAASQNRQLQPKHEQYSHTLPWQSFQDRYFQQQSRALWPAQTAYAPSVPGQHVSYNPAPATQSSFYAPESVPALKGVLTSPQDIAEQARIIVTHKNLREAEAFYDHVANPKDTRLDKSFPHEDGYQVQAVKRIIYAMRHMRNATDNEGMKRMWERAQRDNQAVERTAWKLLRRCMDACAQRDALVSKLRPTHTYNMFEEQMNDICQALMTQKTICKHLCAPDYTDTFIDDPVGAATRVGNNRKVNGGKKKTIAQGKEALKLVGQQRSETSMEPGYDMLLGSTEQSLTRQLTQRQGSLTETQSLLDHFDTTPEAEVDEGQPRVQPQGRRTSASTTPLRRVRITGPSTPTSRNQPEADLALASEMQEEYRKPTTRRAAAKKSSPVETTTKSTRKRKTDAENADATYQPKTASKRTRTTKKESKYPTVRLPNGEYVVKPSAPTPPSSTPPPPASILSSSPYVPSSTSYSSPSGAVSRPRTRTQYRPNPYQPNVYHQPTSYDDGYTADTLSYQNPNMVSSGHLTGQPSAQAYNGYGNGLSNYGQQYGGAHFSNIRGQYDGQQDYDQHQSFPDILRSQSHIDPSLAAMDFNQSNQGNREFESAFGGGSTAAADQHSIVDVDDEFDEDETYGGRQPGEGRGKRRRARPAKQ